MPEGHRPPADLTGYYANRNWIIFWREHHTTSVMPKGTPDDVRAAVRQTLRNAAAGGRFILSTGDPCGRDTPEEDLFALVETVKTHGVQGSGGSAIR